MKLTLEVNDGFASAPVAEPQCVRVLRFGEDLTAIERAWDTLGSAFASPMQQYSWARSLFELYGSDTSIVTTPAARRWSVIGRSHSSIEPHGFHRKSSEPHRMS